MKDKLPQFIHQHRRIELSLLLISPLLLLVVILKLAGGEKQQSQGARDDTLRVDVITINYLDGFQRPRALIGKIESGNMPMIGFEAAGRIISLTVDEGQYVKKGQVLGLLDTEATLAQQERIAASLQGAEAEARLARLSEQRISRLIQQGLESEQRLDEARERTKAADGAVNEILALQQANKVQLDDAILRAPFDGLITQRLQHLGSMVANGQPVFALQDMSALRVRVAVASDTARLIPADAEATLEYNDNEYSVFMSAKTPFTDPVTQTQDLLFAFDHRQKNVADFVVGELVSIHWMQPVTQRGFWVPISALSAGVRGTWRVLTVEGLGDGQLVVPKHVTIVFSEGQRAYVTGSVNASDYVLRQGVHKLVSKQRVHSVIHNERVN